MSAFCPSTTKGSPGIVAPATSSPGAFSRAKYHSAGALSLRWGSLASSGAPVVVREPDSTQLLLPTPSTPEGGAASKPCVRAATRSGPRPSERYSAA